MIVFLIILPQIFSDRPLVMGHRGSAGILPENSLESFVTACYSGADYTEMDMQISKDKVLYIMHDETLNRNTDIKYHVEFQHKKRSDG